MFLIASSVMSVRLKKLSSENSKRVLSIFTPRKAGTFDSSELKLAPSKCPTLLNSAFSKLQLFENNDF